MTTALLLETGHGTSSLARVLLVTAFSPVLCGISLGFTYGSIGGALTNVAFRKRFHNPSDQTTEPLAAIMQAGCVFGSILAGLCADRYGRRRSILAAMSLVMIAACILALPASVPGDSLALLFLGRFLTGVGGGLACSVVPLHVSESAPAEHRGAIEASFQLAIELGILGAYLINYWAAQTSSGWVVSLASAAPTTAVFLVLGAFFLPESPRFLVLHDRQAEAQDVLTRTLRTPDHDVGAELVSMQAEVRDARASASTWSALFAQGTLRSVLVAVTILMLQVTT